MSDIPVDPTVPVADPSTPPPDAPQPDPLEDALKLAVAAAVKEALAAAPAWVKRLGTCTSYSTSTQTANVLLDGDTAEVPCMIQTVRPNPNDRVVVEIVPGDVGSVAWVVGKVGGTDTPAGTVMWITGGSTADPPPAGCLWALGQTVAIASYPALYAVIGTTYGGSGTDFVLPNLQRRMILGDDGSTSVGNTGGSETHTIAQANLPAVNFTVSGGTVSGSVTINNNTTGISATTNANRNDGSAAAAAGGDVFVSLGGSSVSISDGGHGHTGSLSGASYTGGTAASGGSGSSINHLPPYLVANGAIKF